MVITESDLQHFHLHTNKENPENGLVINRDDVVKTFSVTQTVIQNNKVQLLHFDLHNKLEYINSFLII